VSGTRFGSGAPRRRLPPAPPSLPLSDDRLLSLCALPLSLSLPSLRSALSKITSNASRSAHAPSRADAGGADASSASLRGGPGRAARVSDAAGRCLGGPGFVGVRLRLRGARRARTHRSIRAALPLSSRFSRQLSAARAYTSRQEAAKRYPPVRAEQCSNASRTTRAGGHAGCGAP
jgi:hypothetical protein